MTTGLYLFCLLPAIFRPLLEGPGIDDRYALAVETVDQFAAILAPVDLELFCGPGAQEQMANLNWMAPRVRRHEEVILEAMTQGAVLPVRFGTVFSSLAALSDALQRHQEVLKRFFEELGTQSEWIVKGYVNRFELQQQLLRTGLKTEAASLSALPPGRRYLQEKQLRSTTERDIRSLIRKTGDSLEYYLRKRFPHFCPCHLQAPNGTGRRDEQFFHGALLVPPASLADLESRLISWNHANSSREFWTEWSGPWPAYHFTPEW